MYRVGLIGPGRVGRAIVRHLQPSRYRLRYVMARSLRGARRSVREMGAGEATADALSFNGCEIVLIATPSAAIPALVEMLSDCDISWVNKVIFAVSGTVNSSVFSPLSEKGVSAGTLFPLRLFQPQPASLGGVQFAIEGDAVALRTARQLITSLGAEYQKVTPQQKLRAALAMAIATDFPAGVFEAAVAAAVDAGFRRKHILPVMSELIQRSASEYSRSTKLMHPDSILGDNASDLCDRLEAATADPRLRSYFTEVAARTRSILRSNGEPD